MFILNTFSSNDVLFYGMFVGVACHVGFYLVSSIWYSGNKQVDKGVQTDAWEDYSDTPSQIASDNLTSLDTMTLEISPSELVNSTSVS